MPGSIHVIDKDNAGVNDIWICIGKTERYEKKGFVMGVDTGSWRAVGEVGQWLEINENTKLK